MRKRNAEMQMKLTSSVTCNRHPRRARPPRKLYVCRQFGYKMTFSFTSEERRAYNSTHKPYFYCFLAKDYYKREDLLQFTANKRKSTSLEKHLNRRETAVFIDQVTEG